MWFQRVDYITGYMTTKYCLSYLQTKKILVIWTQLHPKLRLNYLRIQFNFFVDMTDNTMNTTSGPCLWLCLFKNEGLLKFWVVSDRFISKKKNSILTQFFIPCEIRCWLRLMAHITNISSSVLLLLFNFVCYLF